MYERNDFSNPSFAITTPTFLTDARRDCPEDCQIVEFLTVANYKYFNQLQMGNHNLHRQVEIQYTGCQKRCSSAPNLTFMPGKYHYSKVNASSLPTLLDKHLSEKS